MADTLTLIQLRTRVRERADMVGSTFVSDTELNGYINSSYQELYDKLVEAVQDYNITQFDFTIASGNTQAVPAAFYKVRGIDDLSSVPSKTVRKFNFNERNDYAYPPVTVSPSSEFSDVTYRLIGNNLLFLPAELAPRSYKLWYVPVPTALSGDSDTADGIQGWNEYVVVDAAIKCLIKEESDVGELLRAKKGLNDRIDNMKHDRDQSQPEKVARVRNKKYYGRLGYVPDHGL